MSHEPSKLAASGLSVDVRDDDGAIVATSAPLPSRSQPNTPRLLSSNSFSAAMHSAEQMSMTVPSEQDHVEEEKNRSQRKIMAIRSEEIYRMALEWIMDPTNLAIVIWCIPSGIIFLFVMLLEFGFLNNVIKSEKSRENIAELGNQIMMALFVLMCVVVHPIFIRKSYQLWRWSEKDIIELRKEYCKGGTRKPHEWFHMQVVVFWLHQSCILTYALGACYWFYTRQNRSTLVVFILTIASFVAPALAAIHLVVSPLGRDYHELEDEPPKENGDAVDGPKGVKLMERSVTFVKHNKIVEAPEWQGSAVSGWCLDVKFASLSVPCMFCLFGVNAERLGYGNRFVQGLTFALMVIGPILIFMLAAGTIRNNLTLNRCLLAGGVGLGWLGFCYGGWFRFRMRLDYSLPGLGFCCGSPFFSDMLCWLLCPFCALTQEVRTADHYDISDHHFMRKTSFRDEEKGEAADHGEDAASAPGQEEMEKD